MMARLSDYGGRMITTDGTPTVELVDPNDHARRRFQYRRAADGGLERRVLADDGRPFLDTGWLWEPVDVSALQAVRGSYHPILDPLGL